jgi:hypothetical protein
VYEARCDCGTVRVVRETALRNGKSQSCGQCIPRGRLAAPVKKYYDRLRTMERVTNDKQGRAQYRCICSCGRETIVRGAVLRQGLTKSCGVCIRRKHGGAARGRTLREYQSYGAAKCRCTNKNSRAYKNYGAVGVKFSFTSFAHFIAVLGLKPTPAHTLGRYLDTGNYEKGNCAWQTRAEQRAEAKGKKAMLLWRTKNVAA